MGDRQTLADAIEHGPDLNVRPNGQYEQRIFEDGWDLALDRVKSGEVVTPEMQALEQMASWTCTGLDVQRTCVEVGLAVELRCVPCWARSVIGDGQ